MLFLFYRDFNAFTIKQAEEPVAKIYFKRNTAQRKFIDNDIWEVLTNSSDIYDGDRIRTSRDSEAYTEFNDTGIQIQLREKSMVQIFKNKKERSVDFIGGEIFVANKSPEEKLVVRSAKKDIAIAQASEVKLSLPDISEAVAAGEETPALEDTTVVIEVISGKVEIIEEPDSASKSKEKNDAEPVIVSAGETVILEPVIEAPAVEKTVANPEPEKNADEKVIAEESSEENLFEEEFAETVSEKAKSDSVSVTAFAEEAAENDSDYEVETEAEAAAPEELYKPIEFRKEKTTTRESVTMRRDEWFDMELQQTAYNRYVYSMSISEFTGEFRQIPKGSTIRLDVSGVPDKDLYEFIIEITNSIDEDNLVHPYMTTVPDYGRGLKQGQRFNVRCHLTLTSDIENTNISYLKIYYERDKLDEPLNISDLEIKATVLPEGYSGVTNEINWKFAKTYDYDSIKPIKNVYGDGPDDYNYKFDMNGDAVFGNNIHIPKGKKFKVSISGVSDKAIQRFHLELLDNTEGNWTQCFMYKIDNDWDKLNFSQGQTSKGKKFNYTKTYTINQELLNSNSSRLSLVIDNEGLKEPPEFTDLQINIVLE